MNEVKLTGKVLNSYVHDVTGVLITKIAVRHNHIIGKQNISCESVFNTIMQSEEAIKNADWKKGDTVLLTGYLKVDYKTSEKGNEHQKLMVYATKIEVIQSKI